MVAINQKTKTDTDLVCPECFKALEHRPTVINNKPDRYGRTIRNYYGWCHECDTGFEVVQFKRDARWCIHKFRYYAANVDVEAGAAVPDKDWQVLNDLPAPSIVVLGPGGDYDMQIELLKECQGSAAKLAKALGLLLHITRGKV